MLLVWKEEFAIDRGPIDKDHRVLVARVNDVLMHLSDNPRVEAVRKAIYSLRTYADFHFRREERLQAETACPGLVEHAAEHRDVLARFDNLIDELESLPADAVVPEHKTKKAMLYRWILHHLHDTDRVLKQHLAARGTDAGATDAIAAPVAGRSPEPAVRSSGPAEST
jgi:hemerythrin